MEFDVLITQYCVQKLYLSPHKKSKIYENVLNTLLQYEMLLYYSRMKQSKITHC